MFSMMLCRAVPIRDAMYTRSKREEKMGIEAQNAM